MKTELRNKPLFRTTTCNTGKIITLDQTREQAMTFIPGSEDHFLSTTFGRFGYRNAEGQWIERSDLKGLGDVCLALLEVIQNAAGEFLTPHEICRLTGYDSLRHPNNISGRLLKLRKLHDETYRQQRFFITRRNGSFAVMWNPQLSWARTEKVAH